jgi:hypothetical protein
MKSSRVPRTLDGLVEAAQQDVPSNAELSRLADNVEAGPVSATRRVMAHLSTPRGLFVLAACLVVSGAVATTLTRDRAPSLQVAAPVAAPPTPSPPTIDRPRASSESHEDGDQKEELPTVDVRSLPSSALPQARREAPLAAADEELSESALLQLAHDTMATNPHRTLALTVEHARRFPAGMLVQEREVIAVEALARLGRRDDARARAATFLATYPSSAYRSRVGEAVGDAHSPEAPLP